MIKNCFENIENELSAKISIAKKRILVAVAWFTNSRLFDGLTLALERNVEVKILILDDILNRNEFGLDFGVLSKLGAEVRLAKSDKGTMHNKFCIIDDVVITGSYNWTYHANGNSENILVTDEDCVVDSYRKEFDRLFGDATAIPQPYEHLKWTDVKEGDFSELRRNIFRDVIAMGDENIELKRFKLISLNRAFKSGCAEDLVKASSLPTKANYKGITEVLTSRSREYEFKLWMENADGKPINDVIGYIRWGKWFYVPYIIKEDQYHQLCVEGALKVYSDRGDIWYSGLNLRVSDEVFVKTISSFWAGKTQGSYELIPAEILSIEWAKMVCYSFTTPMYNKSQPRTQYNYPRLISGINLFSIAKQVEGDNVTFYEGWNPQQRGEKIMNEFFVKGQ